MFPSLVWETLSSIRGVWVRGIVVLFVIKMALTLILEVLSRRCIFVLLEAAT
jgi:hypothetical protein